MSAHEQENPEEIVMNCLFEITAEVNTGAELKASPDKMRRQHIEKTDYQWDESNHLQEDLRCVAVWETLVPLPSAITETQDRLIISLMKGSNPDADVSVFITVTDLDWSWDPCPWGTEDDVSPSQLVLKRMRAKLSLLTAGPPVPLLHLFFFCATDRFISSCSW